MFDKNEIQKLNGILQANALNPNLIGPTLPPIPPFTLPTGPTGETGPTGGTGPTGETGPTGGTWNMWISWISCKFPMKRCIFLLNHPRKVNAPYVYFDGESRVARSRHRCVIHRPNLRR
ncbi:exosporium leader peptide-containing protein [Bacillus mycoides]